MAKNDVLMFVIFLSIAGICFYKWILIHVKMKNMIIIKCKCTDIITRTMYHKNIYEYYYVYESSPYKFSSYCFFDIANLLKNIICTKFKAKNYKILIAFVCLLFKMV